MPFLQNITRGFSEAYYSGTSAGSASAGTVYDVALGGRGYMLDLRQESGESGYQVKSLPLLQRYYLTQTQGNLGEQCVDEQTEILTQRGWKSCYELMVGDWVWTLRVEDGTAEWQPVHTVNVWPERQRVLTSLEARNHSSLSTSNHRWPIAYKNTRGKQEHKRRIETTDRLNSNASFLTAAPAAVEVEPKFSDAFVELVGWFWAEGSITVRSDGSVRRCEVAQSRKVNQPKVDRIRSLFVRLFAAGTWKEYENPNGCTQFQFHPDALPELLDVMETVKPYKAVHPEFVAALTQGQLRLFIEGCFLGDGYWNGRSHLMAQKYREGLASIQMACVLAGYRTSLSEKPFPDGRGQWKLQWHDKWTQVNVAEMSRKEVRHTGRVWCPTVANGTWMARRNGTCYFTGNSLNPEDYWRRSVDNWANGSGQRANDHDTSIRSRFYTSKGIDCWTPGSITLLKDTSLLLASANTNLGLAIAGTYLYVLDGGALKYTQATSFTTVTGTALSSAATITSDGFTVWIVDANRTYYTTRGNATYAAYHTVDRPGSLVRSVKGRLFVANANIIYTNSGAAGSATATAFYTHPNSDWTWVDVAEGPTAIYFAGFSGDKSIIYQTAVLADGTNLSIPAAAATLPSGEIVRSICGYLGVMMIGTDKGVRVAAIDSQGNLTVGDLITTSTSVRCFEPQGSFVWFGYTNYDGTSTGLGRVNLGVFNDSAPAYATDLMATVQGAVSSVVTFGGVRAFTVQGSGIWIEHATNRVATGVIVGGQLNYALPDPKIAVKFVISYLPGAGTITAALASDSSTFVQMGGTITTSSTDGANTTLPAGLASGLVHEVQLTLTRGSDTTQAPIIDRWVLLANPAPERRVRIDVALRLHHQVQLLNGITKIYDPVFERAQINAWCQTNEVITFQDAESSYAVTVDDFDWKAYANVDARVRSWDGTMLVTLKEIGV